LVPIKELYYDARPTKSQELRCYVYFSSLVTPVYRVIRRQIHTTLQTIFSPSFRKYWSTATVRILRCNRR